MKIVLINTLYHPFVLGGAERSVQTIAEGLAESGHEPVVIATHPDPERKAEEVNGISVRYVRLRNLYWPFEDKAHKAPVKALWHAADVFNSVMGRAVGDILDKERGVDIVNTHTIAGFSTAVWQEIKKRRHSLVHTLHDYYLLCPRSTMFRGGSTCDTQCRSCALYSAPKKRFTRYVDAVTGVSRFILDLHAEYGAFPNATTQEVIPNAVDDAELPDNTVPRVAKRPLRLGYLGRLHPTKGLEVIASALGELPTGDWQLSIAGRGDQEYEIGLRSLFASFPNVEFAGHVDAAQFLESIDVLILPSLWRENSPMVVYEALAHGVPIVGARRGGIPELVDDGETGLLFEPSRPSELADALIALIDDPDSIARMSVSCRRSARRFSTSEVVGRYLALYQRLTTPALA